MLLDTLWRLDQNTWINYLSRKLFQSSFVITLFLLITDASVGAVKGRIELVKLTDQIYVVEDHFYYRENSAIYIGEKDVTVISATWTPETARLLADKVRSVTEKPIKSVINTHFHLDRVGGNPYFKSIGAKIIASNRTTELMKKNWDSRIEEAQSGFPGYPSIPYTSPDVTFDEKYELEDGKIQVLFLGPSHTEDNIVVYFPKEEVLFGDCVLKERLGNLDDANLDEYPKTLERIKRLKIRTIIAGHWSSLHGPELIDKLLKHLKERSVKGNPLAQ